ncbi:GNAT family N-acetyltransferase [Algibacter miyuki]|uniref:GNAT family N-acetyltransferase n=1 Tax=Algibacter miyuki TaxID=1306933 RepID=A0ABV5GZM3_9FLAO|nr:GNAT family protein [Algibacter miyuki]MDN3666899.1 GNAT family protein [Algibacter miyuki]
MTSPILENNRVKLTLLDLNNYTEIATIGQQDKLVLYSPSKIATPEDLKTYAETAVAGYQNKTVIPFLVFDKQTNTYAGTTRFAYINKHDKVLHIGWTWIGHEFQGTGLNMHMKFLMLQYAFETLKFDKVEFRADERNIASRKAIEKIGGTLEGILRKDMLMLDGFKRSSCCYGILKEEWPNIKKTNFAGFE